jgi:hypothetical protein
MAATVGKEEEDALPFLQFFINLTCGTVWHLNKEFPVIDSV